MIYIDVTAACLLPLQTGIPRTTRGLYRLLREDQPAVVTPMVWQPFRRRYTALSSHSQALLEDPFAGQPDRRAPRDSTWPLLWASFSDLASGAEKIPLHRLLKPTDTLLLTSIFPDNRLAYLRRIASCHGRHVALFHDAIPLRDRNVPRWEKERHRQTIRLLARMDLVIAVSESARADLLALWVKHRIPAAPTVVLPWPVPFHLARPAFVAPSFDPPRVLYVSRLKQLKNHQTLFTACEMLWRAGLNFKLDLIGCEDEAAESRAILGEIKRLQRAARPICWRGHVSETELHEAYRRATLTVFPSLAEGFGLPIIESLWHGRPVVCGNQEAIGELTSGGGCVITDVQQPETLAATLRELLENKSLCQAYALQAAARPLRSWDDYARDFLPLLAPP